ncbi:UDP-xylose and UDP-N-acetylglucosamine transporter-like [Hydractinia symbiolongicarpus]|uniref:UDP-xylose and UDP-N-acetylglucosamine transporter-like n=1 Tax=Hydractinia symbiolongicarpus TaxID=13093 RepID=UPI00254C8EB7|nr:UDP-xylose and UDP-N-acetylglucosamine transporter-like [Hydractinia symbiolongicarpus]
MLKVVVAVLTTFGACSANVVFLEHLVKYSPGCGDIIAFAQFLFTSCYGFVAIAKFGSKKPVVPIKEYVVGVLLFFGTTVAGNLALGCNISMPIQMIFKSGSVLASLTLGVLLLKKSYPVSKYVSVVMISVGIAMCLLVSADDKQSTEEKSSKNEYLVWLFGIFLLLTSLFMGATLGVVQENMAVTYGKQPDEMLFYSHALALPGFLFFGSNIIQQSKIFSNSEMYPVPYISVQIPIVWLYLVLNVLTQFVCIRSVYVLATEVSALALTVILTLRKFMSLMISIYYFNNPFTIYHWCGTALVFGGTLLFSGVIQSLANTLRGSLDTKKKEE